MGGTLQACTTTIGADGCEKATANHRIISTKWYNTVGRKHAINVSSIKQNGFEMQNDMVLNCY